MMVQHHAKGIDMSIADNLGAEWLAAEQTFHGYAVNEVDIFRVLGDQRVSFNLAMPMDLMSHQATDGVDS